MLKHIRVSILNWHVNHRKCTYQMCHEPLLRYVDMFIICNFSFAEFFHHQVSKYDITVFQYNELSIQFIPFSMSQKIWTRIPFCRWGQWYFQWYFNILNSLQLSITFLRTFKNSADANHDPCSFSLIYKCLWILWNRIPWIWFLQNIF